MLRPGRSFVRSAVPLLLLCPALAAPARAASRIVAVGDVHGAFRRFVSILQATHLIDSNRRWIGGDTILVQTGDLVDRGPQSREAMDLMMSLETQAPKQRGKVIVILGNHEVLNMLGSWRPTDAADYRPFAGPDSGKKREEAYREYREYLAARDKRRGVALPPEDKAERAKWIEEHPAGFFERADAYGPKGQYGSWLRRLDSVAQVNDVVFAHAGLDPEQKFESVEEINQRIHSEIASIDALWQVLSEKKLIWRYMNLKEASLVAKAEVKAARSGGGADSRESRKALEKMAKRHDWLVMSKEGPMWYRGIVHKPKEGMESELQAMLSKMKARYIVVAHSPIKAHNIKPALNGLAFRIDTGMTEPDGKAAALEIKDGRFTAYYADGHKEVFASTPTQQASTAPRPTSSAKGKTAGATKR